jgi:hypothetical protein
MTTRVIWGINFPAGCARAKNTRMKQCNHARLSFSTFAQLCSGGPSWRFGSNFFSKSRVAMDIDGMVFLHKYSQIRSQISFSSSGKRLLRGSSEELNENGGPWRSVRVRSPIIHLYKSYDLMIMMRMHACALSRLFAASTRSVVTAVAVNKDSLEGEEGKSARNAFYIQ